MRSQVCRNSWNVNGESSRVRYREKEFSTRFHHARVQSAATGEKALVGTWAARGAAVQARAPPGRPTATAQKYSVQPGRSMHAPRAAPPPSRSRLQVAIAIRELHQPSIDPAVASGLQVAVNLLLNARAWSGARTDTGTYAISRSRFAGGLVFHWVIRT